MRAYEENLATLNLKPEDLELLSPEEQRTKINQQWRKLCLRYHPDKNSNYRTQFDMINAAHTQLNDLIYKPVIEEFYNPEIISIPNTAFDLVQEEGILQVYEALLFDFSNLRTDNAKQSFINFYAPFLNLARSLKLKSVAIHGTRMDHLYELENERLENQLRREWRIMILRLYGEEFLDDFAYREAIKTGDLRPILSSIKLLSPIKLVVALINTVLLGITTSSDYIFKKILLNVMQDFLQQYNRIPSDLYNQTRAYLLLMPYEILRLPDRVIFWLRVLKEKMLGFQILTFLYGLRSFDGKIILQRLQSPLLILSVKILALLALLVLPMYLNPVLYCYAFSLPLIFKILELLACPVNQGIRPLANRLNCSPILFSGIGGIVSIVALSYALLQASSLATISVFVLPYLILALDLYALYNLVQVIRKMYEIQPALAIFQVILIALSILLQFLFLAPTNAPGNDVVSEPVFSDFLMLLTLSSILEGTKHKLNNLSAVASEMTEILPFPQEAIASEIKASSQIAYKTASWSHRLFHTPKGAEYLRPEERTIRQQWTCFFGGGERPNTEKPYFADEEIKLLR